MFAIHPSFTLQLSDLSWFLLASLASFSCFQNVSLREICDLINKMKTTASSLDVIPSEIIKAPFSEIGTSIQSLINLSLTAGVVPKYFKHALVQPLLKKQGLEEGCRDNYRPVSKLSFLSKRLEKVVYSQLISFLNEAKLT